MLMDAIDDIASNALGVQHHRVAEGTAEQGGIHKAWTDIGKPDIKSALMRGQVRGLWYRQ